MPAHAHGMDTNGAHTHRHDFWDANDLNWNTRYGGPYPIGSDDRGGGWSRDLNTTGNHRHTIHQSGGGANHNNMSPFFVLAYIMKL